MDKGAEMLKKLGELFSMLKIKNADLMAQISIMNQTIVTLTMIIKKGNNRKKIGEFFGKLNSQVNDFTGKLKEFNNTFEKAFNEANEGYSKVFIDLHENDGEIQEGIIEHLHKFNEVIEFLPSFNTNINKLKNIYTTLNDKDTGIPLLSDKACCAKTELVRTLSLTSKAEKDIMRFSGF